MLSDKEEKLNNYIDTTCSNCEKSNNCIGMEECDIIKDVIESFETIEGDK